MQGACQIFELLEARHLRNHDSLTHQRDDNEMTKRQHMQQTSSVSQILVAAAAIECLNNNKMGRHDDDRNDSDSDDEDRRSKRKRKHRHKSSSRKHDDRKSRKKERRRSPSEEEASASSSSSDSYNRRKDRKRRKKEKKQRKKAERREKKHSKRARRNEKTKDDDSDSTQVSARLERNYQFTNALQSLLEVQPGMASELPILLIRMADGTSFNVDQMPDARVSARLQEVLATLSPFGLKRDETGSWSWNSGAPSNKKDPLLLIKIARTLLDEIGMTMDAVENYEKEKEALHAKAVRQVAKAQEAGSNLHKQTASLLQQFQKKQDSDGPTLAQELATLCTMILSGESISLDGLPDEALREGIETLFRAAGLEKSEMEDSDNEDRDDDDEPVMGYSLPDDSDSRATANMTSVLETFKASATTTTPKRVVKGPMMPPPDFAADHGNEYDDEEDEEGPAPIGSEKATKRVQKGPSLPPEVIKAMAEKRKRELAEVTGEDITQAGVAGEREQWMLEPGEHDFLQGIKTGNAIKSRNFENKKKKARAVEAPAPMDPSVQAEVDAIMEMQREARGPSLIEQHRIKIAEEKAEAAKGGKEEWKWSRDKDLDAGRRVDKNALNMVMGSAAGNLKDKFQGGLSRGFM